MKFNIKVFFISYKVVCTHLTVGLLYGKELVIKRIELKGRRISLHSIQLTTEIDNLLLSIKLCKRQEKKFTARTNKQLKKLYFRWEDRITLSLYPSIYILFYISHDDDERTREGSNVSQIFIIHTSLLRINKDKSECQFFIYLLMG